MAKLGDFSMSGLTANGASHLTVKTGLREGRDPLDDLSEISSGYQPTKPVEESDNLE